MQLFSPSTKHQFPLFSPSSNPNHSRFHFMIPIETLQFSSPLKIFHSSRDSAPALEQKLICFDSDEEENNEIEGKEEGTKSGKELNEGLLMVRRPVMEFSREQTDGSLNENNDGDDIEEEQSSTSVIDAGLSKFAKKMPIFEPERVELSSKEKPLGVNLELGLYRAKVLARNYRFEEAKEILQKCILFWPEDGRPYVALGKVLSKQSKAPEARQVYERGCQATQGENPYIWQCWAVLENKKGNIRRARELFDAATVADKSHIAAWHGWAVLELKQGNIKKARNLLGKALKYCGGNEYIYQTLALLEAKANRIEQARYLFKQATKCNPKSCASWLAWAQVEMQQENNLVARKLFEKAVQASPKNRFAWHVWGIFEANMGDSDKGRKLLKIGHTLNPRDPVLLQSLALLEYKYSTANLARVLFRRASELDPRHQAVWTAWGWMEWKEGNISTARQLYQRALSINSTSESAAHCLQAWGVLEQRLGNLSAARRLFRSSLNINSQSYVTWMTWASMEEEQGNVVRAEEIRNLYFQQRTEVVDDASWVMGFLDVIDPALDSIKRLLNFDQNSYFKGQDALRNTTETNGNYSSEELSGTVLCDDKGSGEERPYFPDGNNLDLDAFVKEKLSLDASKSSNFDLDAFIREKLSLDASKLDVQMDTIGTMEPKKTRFSRRIWRSKKITPTTLLQP